MSRSATSGLLVVGTAVHVAALAVVVGAGAVWSRLAVPWFGDRAIGESLAWGPVAGGAIVAASWAMTRWCEAGRRLERTLAPTVAGMRWPQALVLAVGAGVAEEAVFRGALWTLAASWWGDAAAWVLTTALFGAVHGLFVRRLRAWGLFALAAGLVLGALRWGTGGILAPVAAHVVIDAINLPLLARRGSAPATDEPRHAEQDQS